MTNGQSHSVPVEILGRIYQIRAKDNKQYVLDLAKMVNDKMIEVEQSTQLADSLKIAVLACLNLADEHLKFKLSRENRIKELEDERKRLLALIDDATGREPKDTLPDS